MIWLSAQEIAEAAKDGHLPGLPTSKRGVNILAERENWADSGLARSRGGRNGGGGLEYHVNLLPSHARSQWIGHNVHFEDKDQRPDNGDMPIVRSQEARTVILRATVRLKTKSCLSQTASDEMFCAAFNAGSIPFETWVTESITSITPRTLARWRKAISERKPMASTGRPVGSGVLDRAEDGEVRAMILGAIMRQPFLDAGHLRILIKDRFGERLTISETGREINLPSVRTFQNSIAYWRVEYKNELTRHTDPDAYRNRIEMTVTGTQRADRLNEIWQLDASPADVMLVGKKRHSIYMLIDIFSRRTILLVTPTPRAEGVGLLMRKGIAKWGIPESVKTDNGSDFIAKQIKRLMAALDIEIDLSEAFEPRTKGMVERVIGTFQRDTAALPGFIGHSVADRKVLEARKSFAARLGTDDAKMFEVDLDIKEFQAWCDAWTDTMYAHDKHGGLQGRTPHDVAASYDKAIRQLEHPEVLDVLLAPIANNGGVRTVTKQGVKVDKEHYLSMGVAVGTKVMVRMDPADLGRVMLFDVDSDEFLGEALNWQLLGLNPAEVQAKSRALQKAQEDDISADMKRWKRKLKPRDVADAMLRDGMQRSAAAVVPFPRAQERAETPATQAAMLALDMTPVHASKTRKVSDAALKTVQLDVEKERRSKKDPTQEKAMRIARAIKIGAMIEGGMTVSADDRQFYDNYITTIEWRAQQSMREDAQFKN